MSMAAALAMAGKIIMAAKAQRKTCLFPISEIVQIY